jgi:hypothetical protein
MNRPTAPFAIFYRSVTGESCFACHACAIRRHDTFTSVRDAFAVAAQHLTLCRGAMLHRPVEGVAFIDGREHGLVLREGFMILALPSAFETSPRLVRVVA